MGARQGRPQVRGWRQSPQPWCPSGQPTCQSRVTDGNLGSARTPRPGLDPAILGVKVMALSERGCRVTAFKGHSEDQSPILSTQITDQSTEAKRDLVLGTRMDTEQVVQALGPRQAAAEGPWVQSDLCSPPG